jgi:hypothetical protein
LPQLDERRAGKDGSPAMAEDPDPVSALAHDIERYLEDRPHASDTVDGIRRWWLRGRWADASPPHVSAALELLVRRGVMTRRTLADGSAVYLSSARKD